MAFLLAWGFMCVGANPIGEGCIMHWEYDIVTLFHQSYLCPIHKIRCYNRDEGLLIKWGKIYPIPTAVIWLHTAMPVFCSALPVCSGQLGTIGAIKRTVNIYGHMRGFPLPPALQAGSGNNGKGKIGSRRTRRQPDDYIFQMERALLMAFH